jgi:UDP-D-galactose:(glucosyl)LPS alpha-1,6-D-galactosyltransferase
LKIDIVSDRRDGKGGMETVFTLLDTELRRRGISVRVILSEPSIHVEWESTLGDVYHVMKDTSWIDTKDYERYEKIQRIEMELFYKNMDKPDAVLVATKGLEVPIRSALGPDVRIFSWPHLNLNLRVTDDGADFKAADGFLALCEGIRKQSIRKNPMLPAFTIGNPLEIDVVPVPRPKTTPTFIYMGRITEQKRVDWIIKAFAKLRKKAWNLKIIGGGNLESQVFQLAKQLGIYSRIEWLPFQEDPWGQVQEASVLLLSSWFEGFPMVILESLARGIPVISTDCPVGPADSIVHGQNGFLVGLEDFDSFVDIISDLMDGNLPLPSIDACRDSVRKYDASVVVERILEAVNSLKKVESVGL